MSNVPEIAPEIRGLLEEIVADPRSSIRLVPQRALRGWFEKGEPVKTREVATTRAERHLVEVHREALAAILKEASLVSYWKAPVLSHQPTDLNGRPYNPAHNEERFTKRARPLLNRTTERSPGVALLRSCLEGIHPGISHHLAKAALGLVPSESHRFCVAFTVPWGSPRTGIHLLQRCAATSHLATFRHEAFLSLGARLCALGMMREALAYYYEANLAYHKHGRRFYAFHLCCLLQDRQGAIAEAAEFEKLDVDDPAFLETIDILRQWAKTRTSDELRKTRMFVDKISGHIPNAALALFGAYSL